MEQKLNQLRAKMETDQSFVEKLFSLEKPEEVQGLLKEEGMDFSLEEINMVKEALVKIIGKGENAELSDEDLEEVAGGVAAVTVFAAISATAAAASAINNITRGRW